MTTATATLTEFLLARIAEDEAYWGNPALVRLSGPHLSQLVLKVRAECEAKRRIVAMCEEDEETAKYIVGVAYDGYLRALAAVYADHPDYREEWRP